MSNCQSSHPLATEKDISLGSNSRYGETHNQEDKNEIEAEIEDSGEQKGEEVENKGMNAKYELLSPKNLTLSKRSNSHLSIKGQDQAKKFNSKAMD